MMGLRTRGLRGVLSCLSEVFRERLTHCRAFSQPRERVIQSSRGCRIPMVFTHRTGNWGSRCRTRCWQLEGCRPQSSEKTISEPAACSAIVQSYPKRRSTPPLQKPLTQRPLLPLSRRTRTLNPLRFFLSDPSNERRITHTGRRVCTRQPHDMHFARRGNS